MLPLSGITVVSLEQAVRLLDGHTVKI